MGDHSFTLQITDYNSDDAKIALDLYDGLDEQFESYPSNLIVELLKTDPSYHLFIAKEKSKFVGFVLVYFFHDLGICFLDFIAVKKDKQNQGVGTKIVHFLQKLISRYMKNFIGIVSLVLIPDESYNDENKNREKRIQFHLKLGAKRLENIIFPLPPDGNLKSFVFIIPTLNVQPFTQDFTNKLFDEIFRIYNCDNSNLISQVKSQIPQNVKFV